MLQLNWLEKFTLGVIKHGHIPQHIAFIMDGNRRFGKAKSSQAMSGHADGAHTLKKCLLYCLELGVKVASFYAFSLQNFKRSQTEVGFLMDLARAEMKKLSEIYQQDNIVDLIDKNNVKVIFAGDLDGKLKEIFPDVRDGFLKIQERTKNNHKMTMYVCFAYDSIYQYNRSVDITAQRKLLNKDYKTHQEKNQVFQHLQVPHYVDLLVRTSGETRLSNFMLMQIDYGLIYIEKNFWPAFNLQILGKILLQYNLHYNDIKIRRQKALKRLNCDESQR